MEANLQDLSKHQLVDRIKTLEQTVTELQNKNDSLFEENSRIKELFEFSPTPMWEEDITELIEYIKQLKINGVNDFETFFELNPEELNDCIKKIKLIDVNNATLALHKASSKEHLIKNLENLFTNKSFAAFKRRIIAIANGKKNFVTETNTKTFQNELVDLKLYLEIIERNNNGSTKYFALVTTIDTTELKSAESEIFHFEQSFNAILNASQDIIMLVDGEGKVIETNKTLLKLFNIRKLDILGRDISYLLEQGFHISRMKIIDDIFSSGIPNYCEEIILGRTWETSYYPVFNEKNEVISVAIYQKDVTKLLRSSKKIKDSEERLNLVLKAAKLGWWDYNFTNGKSIKSDYWFEMLGYSEENISSDHDFFFSLIHPDDYDRTMKEINAHRNGKIKEIKIEHRLKNSEGNYNWILNWGRVIERQDDGTPLRAAGIYMDISDRKTAELKLHQSEQHYKTLFESQPSIIWDEDFSEVKVGIEELKENGITDFDNYFRGNPEVVKELVAKVKLNDFNSETLNVLEAKNREDIVLNLPYFFNTEEAWKAFQDAIIALANGKQEFESEITLISLRGNTKHLYFKLVVPDEHKSDFKKVLISFVDITDLKASTLKLIEAQQKYSSLVEQTNEGIIINQSWRLKFCNKYFSDMLGYSFNELIEAPIDQFLLPDKAGEVKARFDERLIGDPAPKIYESIAVKKDGTEIPIEINASYMMFEGKPAVQSIIRDISDRKKAEQEKADREKELSLILNATSDRMALVKVETNDFILSSYNNSYWNSLKLLNPSLNWDQLNDISILKLHEILNTPVEFVENVNKIYSEILKSHEQKAVLENFKINDDEITLDSKYTPIINEYNECTHILYVSKDITIQNEAEKKTKLLAKMLESSPIGYLVTDTSGNIIDLNPALEKITNYSRDELLGSNPKILNAEDNANDIQREIFEVIGRGETWVGELKNQKKTGEIHYINSSIFPLFDHGKIISYVGFQNDITERKLAEKQVKESEAYIRSIFSSAPIGIGVVSNRIFQNVNDKLCEIVGYSKDELIGQSSRILYENESEYLRVGEIKYSLIDKSETRSVETKWKRNDGKIIDILLSSTTIDRNNQSKGVTFSALDITEHNLSKKALERSNSRFQALFNNSPIALWEEDFTELSNYLDRLKNDGHHDLREYFDSNPEEILKCSQLVKIEDVNQEALNLHNANSKDELLGNLDKIFTANSLEVFKEEVLNISEGIRQFECEGEVRTLDGIKKIVYLKLTMGIDSKNSQKGLLATIDITDRKKTENALSKSKARLSTLMNNIPGMTYICIADEHWTMLFVNDASTELTGYTPDEIIQNKRTSFASLIHNDDREFVKVSVFEKLKSGEHYEIEYRIIDAVGNLKWVWERGVEVNSEGIDSITLEGVIHDITSRKLAEENVRASEKKFRSLFENMNEGIFYQSRDNKLIDINDSCTEIFGVSRKDFLSRTPFDPIWHVVDADYNRIEPEHFPQMEALRTGKEILNVEVGFKNLKTNKIRWLIVNSIPQFNYGDEKPFQVFVTIHDISSRKEIETNLQKTSQQLDLALKGGEIGIFYWDLRKDEIQIDRRLLKTLEYTKKEIGILTLKALKKYTHPDDLKTNLKIINNDLTEENNTLELEIRIRNFKGNWMWYLIKGKVLDWDAKGKPLHIAGTHLDITQRIKTKNKLRFSEEKYRTVYNNALIALFRVSLEDFKVIEANKVAADLFGYSTTQDFIDNFQGEKLFIQEEETSLLRKLNEKGYIEKIMISTQKKNGSYIWNESSFLLNKEKGYVDCFAVDSTDRVLAQNKILETNEKLRNLYRYMNNVREEERKNIAREVHDNLGQKLTALNLDISLIEQHVPHDNRELKDKFIPVQNLINQSIVTVQRISTELRPGILDDLGLVNAIQWQSNEYSRRTNLKFNLNLAKEEIELEDDVKTQLFRVYQEALTNIVRHAKADNISVNLLFKKNKLIFEVIDDGEGIPIDKVNDNRSFGLIGMRERIASINGEINISDRVRKGTIIKISVPLEETS